MGEIVRISSNTPWEPIAGYSRAVRAGDYVFVSGTTATDERGGLAGVNQMYVQARQALANIVGALHRAGLSAENVIRTRMFVTDIGRWEEAARAHREFFSEIRPSSTMVEVRRLVHPDMLIEIEADAYAPGPAASASLMKAQAVAPGRAPARAKRAQPKPAKAKARPKPARTRRR